IVTGAATGGDPGYNGVDASDVAVTNMDNDVPGITVSPLSGLVTTEAGGSASFTVVLNTQPVASVTITLTSGNPAEGTPAPATLTFTTANWNIPQAVVVTGVDDLVVDGNIAYTLVTAAASSPDPVYDTMNAADVAAVNNDNDSVGIIVFPVGLLITSEAGGSDVFGVRLNSQPTNDVTIPLSSSNPAEGMPGVASITFTPAN